MKKPLFLLFLCILLCPLLFTACGQEEDGDIVIGVMIPLTGTESAFGQDMLASYELAVEEINAAGGVLGRKLVLNVQDDGCDPAQAVNAASRLISAGVDVVTGGYCSGSTSPTLRLFAEANLVYLVSGANSTDLISQGWEQTFLMNPTATVQARAVANCLDWLDAGNRIALIQQGDAYTADLNDRILEVLSEQPGLTIATRELSEKNTADYSAIVTSVCYHQTDVVFFAGYYADAVNLIRQLRQGGSTGPVVLGDGCADPTIIQGTGSAGKNVFVISPPYVEYIPGGQEYSSRYAAHTGGLQPRAFSTLCYDSIYVLAEAITACGSLEYDDLRQAIQDTDYQGLSGRVTFTEDTRERPNNNFMLLEIDPEQGSFLLHENVLGD